MSPSAWPLHGAHPLSEPGSEHHTLRAGRPQKSAGSLALQPAGPGATRAHSTCQLWSQGVGRGPQRPARAPLPRAGWLPDTTVRESPERASGCGLPAWPQTPSCGAGRQRVPLLSGLCWLKSALLCPFGKELVAPDHDATGHACACVATRATAPAAGRAPGRQGFRLTRGGGWTRGGVPEETLSSVCRQFWLRRLRGSKYRCGRGRARRGRGEEPARGRAESAQCPTHAGVCARFCPQGSWPLSSCGARSTTSPWTTSPWASRCMR